MDIELIVTSEEGLHARPVTKLVNLATGFDSDILLSVCGKKVNLKSIMGVMSLGINYGQKITLTFDGADSTKAADTICTFLTQDCIAKLV